MTTQGRVHSEAAPRDIPHLAGSVPPGRDIDVMPLATLGRMATPTSTSRSVRQVIEQHRAHVNAILTRYGASNPRLFGSVARGDATEGSDVDLLVDLDPAADGNPLLRVAGIGEELSALLGVQVDVVTDVLLRDRVATSANADAVAM
jgi:predicted nucleotidyltransferase